MIPAPFEYVRPPDLDGVLRILSDREGDAKILSGGYSLLPLLKLRLAQPGLLVDIQSVTGLDGIVETDDELRIGARATHRQIHESAIIDRYPLLHDVSGGIGDPQVRNWGTIGGSVAHADPASDWPAALLAVECPDRLPRQRRRARDRGPELLPRHVHDRDRADRGPDRDPLRPPAEGPGRRLREARAARRRLRHRRGRDGRPARRRRRDRARRDRRDGRLRVAVRRDRCRSRSWSASSRRTRRSEPPAQAAAAMSEPAADVRGPVDYKRAMVAELTLRSLRKAVERALANA